MRTGTSTANQVKYYNTMDDEHIGPSRVVGRIDPSQFDRHPAHHKRERIKMPLPKWLQEYNEEWSRINKALLPYQDAIAAKNRVCYVIDTRTLLKSPSILSDIKQAYISTKSMLSDNLTVVMSSIWIDECKSLLEGARDDAIQSINYYQSRFEKNTLIKENTNLPIDKFDEKCIQIANKYLDEGYRVYIVSDDFYLQEKCKEENKVEAINPEDLNRILNRVYTYRLAHIESHQNFNPKGEIDWGTLLSEHEYTMRDQFTSKVEYFDFEAPYWPNEYIETLKNDEVMSQDPTSMQPAESIQKCKETIYLTETSFFTLELAIQEKPDDYYQYPMPLSCFTIDKWPFDMVNKIYTFLVIHDAIDDTESNYMSLLHRLTARKVPNVNIIEWKRDCADLAYFIGCILRKVGDASGKDLHNPKKLDKPRYENGYYQKTKSFFRLDGNFYDSKRFSENAKYINKPRNTFKLGCNSLKSEIESLHPF